jgi:beta-mannanase
MIKIKSLLAKVAQSRIRWTQLSLITRIYLVAVLVVSGGGGAAIVALSNRPSTVTKQAAKTRNRPTGSNSTTSGTSTSPVKTGTSSPKAGSSVGSTTTNSIKPGVSATKNSGSSSSGSSVSSIAHSSIALGIAVDDPSSGASNNEVGNYEGAAGKYPAFVEWYQSWTEPLYYSSQKTTVTSEHMTPMISWTTATSPSTAATYASIVNGSQNSTIDSAASLAKQWPGTLYIRFNYEMNVGSSPWEPAKLGETAADFVAGWQYIVNRFNADGVTNVKWVWSPNLDCNGTCPFNSYYPGNNYVNMVGLDGYNYAWLDGVAWETFPTLFQNDYNDITALAPGKPVDIAETACTEPNTLEANAGDSKSAWITQMAIYIPGNMPAVTALTWWSAASDEANFEVNSSASSLAAWKANVVNNIIFQASLN